MVAGALYLLLGLGQGNSALVGTQEWVTWKVTAALSMALVIGISFQGVVALVGMTWGGQGTVPRKTLTGYLIAALALAAAVALFLRSALAAGHSWSVPHMAVRLVAVTAAVEIAAIPWLALVWLTHRAVRLWNLDSDAFNQLVALWDQLSNCVLAFTAFVVVTLVPTGALRVAWFAQSPKPEDSTFPASDVLLYGAFFAALLAAITFPLVSSWRSRASQLVDNVYPLPPAGSITEDWVADRNRLEAVLHLDVGLFRNPLTIFGVFAPLITAALAAFVPQLGS